jgi:hypothetical protein
MSTPPPPDLGLDSHQARFWVVSSEEECHERLPDELDAAAEGDRVFERIRERAGPSVTLWLKTSSRECALVRRAPGKNASSRCGCLATRVYAETARGD